MAPRSRRVKDSNTQNGVIVENNWTKDGKIAFTIVDFIKRQSFYVLRNAYDDGTAAATEASKFKLFDNIMYEADIKNLIREKITVNQAKYKNKFECVDKGDGVFLVKGKCIFSGGNPTRCFTNICGEINCPEEMLSKVMCADVPMECWIQFSFVPMESVDLRHPSVNDVSFKFVSIAKVSSYSEFVSEAPWNNITSSAAYELYDPFVNPRATALKTEKIRHLRGYLLSGKALYIPEKPRMPVLLALNKLTNPPEKQLVPHLPVMVNVCYNDLLKRYIVYEIFERGRCNPLEAELTKDNYHEVDLLPVYNCTGFFQFGTNGLVHDKFGELMEFYNSGLKVKSVFSYVDPDEYSYTSLEIPRSGKITLSYLQKITYEGIYIGNNEFFAPDLHFCVLETPHDSGLEVGHWYVLEIEGFDNERFIATVSATLIPEYERIPSKKIGNMYEFLVKVTFQHSAIFSFLIAPYLGAIGMKDSDWQECIKCAYDVQACGIQFPPSEEPTAECRTQVRPLMFCAYKNYEDGMIVGDYQ